MKICIIGHTEKSYLPFIDKYIEFFNKNGVKYDVIYWNREEQPLNSPKNEKSFFEKTGDSVASKLLSYGHYRKHVLKVLDENNYDKLVILTTVPAIFISGYLKRRYKNKYLFDIRDYSFEKFLPYKKMVDGLIENSEITTISSHGFMDFLDDNKKIVMNHNIPAKLYEAQENDIKASNVINIGFVGLVRYYEENIALISSLKDSLNYNLWYVGKATSDCDLKGYCTDNAIENVNFIGKYSNAQKAELYKNIDIINSIYGNDSPEVVTALPNRLYEACLLKKPIISSKGTFLGEVIERYGLGIAIDVESESPLKVIDDYVAHFDKMKFLKGCEKFLEDVKQDEDAFYRSLKLFVSDNAKK